MSHAKLLLAVKSQTHWSLRTDLSLVWFQVKSGCGFFLAWTWKCVLTYTYLNSICWKVMLGFFFLLCCYFLGSWCIFMQKSTHSLAKWQKWEKRVSQRVLFNWTIHSWYYLRSDPKTTSKFQRKITWSKVKEVFQPLSIFLSPKRHTILEHMANFLIVCQADLL